MNITKKSLTATACSFALTMGCVIILILLTMILPFLEMADPYIVLLLSLLVVFPLIRARLEGLDFHDQILGWTFVGLGAQLLVLPLPLSFIILKNLSTFGLLFGGMVLAGSAVFGVPAGLLAVASGMFLLKGRSF